MTKRRAERFARRWLRGLLRRVPCGRDGIARVGAREIYILPTRTGFLFGTVLMVMLLGSLNYQNNLGLLFTFFLASVGVVAMHHAWFNLLGILVQVRGGPPVFAGETASYEVTLRNSRRHPRHDLRVGAEREFARPVSVPADDQLAVSFGLPARQRGLQRLEELRVETRHPMHLFRAWCHVATDAETLVFPHPARHAPAPEYAAGNPQRLHPSHKKGTEDYMGSRSYRRGDSPRHIDWKAFARERGLVVKEYGSERGREVWIDWSQLGVPDPEIRLGILTRQVLDASDAKVRFGLRLPGVVEGLAQGAAHTQRCLTRLALFEHAQDVNQPPRAT